jgi:hypothetical protein
MAHVQAHAHKENTEEEKLEAREQAGDTSGLEGQSGDSNEDVNAGDEVADGCLAGKSSEEYGVDPGEHVFNVCLFACDTV